VEDDRVITSDGRKPEVITNSIGMKLVLVAAGEFMMGSKESPKEAAKFFERYNKSIKAEWFKREHPRHRVKITKPFWLGMHEVTVGQFQQFVSEAGYKTEPERDGEGAYSYSAETGKSGGRESKYTWRNTGFPQEADHPVVNITWNDAIDFCRWLSQKEGQTYRLPREAEWEYACRAGTTTRYWFGDDPEGLANVANVSDGTAKEKFPTGVAISAKDGFVFTAPVGKFRPNAYGLHDMHGNVYEWCADWYAEDYYVASPRDDPSGPNSGEWRVVRGGSWDSWPDDARSAFRTGFTPGYRVHYFGFRVARTP
jgi:formylglycine-generating enzyme required for sulfatase activity